MKTISLWGTGPRPKASSGMTLIELLVAFMVFVLLIAALVGLTTSSLDTWTEGEARKDIYDRAQIVLETLAEDLRNVYSENEIYTNGQRELSPPAFVCDIDKGRQRLRFVRTGTPAMGPLNAPLPQGQTIIGPMFYAPLYEVAYLSDPDPAKNVLWRGVRPFNRNLQSTLLSPSATMFSDSFRPVEAGVLHVSYRFWTQFTTTWDEGARVQRLGPNSRQASGPEDRWDSQRKDRQFALYKRYDVTNPDFVYPEIVQVTVILESTASLRQAIWLAEGCDDKASALRLNDTKGLPDEPGRVKIGAEWIEYRGKTMTDLLNVRRGLLGTVPAPHAAKDPVHFGESFTTDVRISAYREAQTP